MEYDFSGYATKNDLLCNDGRTIRAGAFKHQSGTKVPLIWSHQHKGPENVLGHAWLENRADGTYTYAKFNDTEMGQTAKQLVLSGDVDKLSIFAGRLVHSGNDVVHGDIAEVSLVLAGANPGAFIDYINLKHSADGDVGDGIIYTDEQIIAHSGTVDESTLKEDDEAGATDQTSDQTTDQTETKDAISTSTEGAPVGDNASTTETLEHAADGEKTVADIYEAFTPEQKDVVNFLVGSAIADQESDGSTNSTEAAHSAIEAYKEGYTMGRNVFDQNGTEEKKGSTLSHAQIQTIFEDGPKYGSVKESFLAHAAEYGIEDIDFLFPDAKTDGNGISFLSRRVEWVADVLDGVQHSPFSRVKSLAADITAEEARAKGYVKGNRKKDEIIKLLKRVTLPKTVYKKQKLDRDDIIDITEIDIIAWLKAEMRLMLNEEIAIAILVGDGRESDDEDKIDEDSIRPIAFDDDMYNTVVELDATPTNTEIIDAIVRSRVNYKGTGTPTLYTKEAVLTDLILEKDTLGRRLYATEVELAAALRVKKIVAVEAMERVTDVLGVIVNLADYRVGADKGGEINLFDDFDIDYNQQKYLIETRISGALTKPKSAVTIKYNQGTVITPNAPTFVSGTGVVTIPAQTGVVYKNDDTNATLTSGAQTALAPGATLNVQAVPATGYSFPHGGDFDWGFTRPAA